MKRSPEFIAEARQFWEAGYTGSEIGARLGVTKNVVIGLANRHHFVRVPNREKWPREKLERAEAMLFDGYSYKETASAIGATAKQVEHRRFKYGWDKRTLNRRAKSTLGRPEASTIAARAKLAPAPAPRRIVNISGVTAGCRYLHGDPADFNWCGQPIEAGSYCQRHYEMCHMKRPVKDATAETIGVWPKSAA